MVGLPTKASGLIWCRVIMCVHWALSSFGTRPYRTVRSGGERLKNMEWVVYVLKDADNKFYKGMTSNLSRRISEHKSGHTKTTARMRLIEVVYSEKFDTFDEARRRELYFKSAAGRRFLKKHLGP